MATPNPFPPSERSKRPLVKRVHWKWSLLAVSLVIALGIWDARSDQRISDRLSGPAVEQFHQLLDAGQYEAICSQALEGFCTSGADGETFRFLKGLHEKFGNTSATKRGEMNLDRRKSGTLVTAQYDTTFAIGAAKETFSWIIGDGTLKLYKYTVESNALFVK